MNRPSLRHNIGTHRDPGVANLISSLGWEGYGLWRAICDTLAEQPTGRYPTSHLAALAFNLHADGEKIKGVICDYGLFRIGIPPQEDPENPDQQGQEFFWSEDIIQQIENANSLSEKKKKAANTRWNKSTTDTDAMQVQCECNASAMQVDSKCNASAMHVNDCASIKEKEGPFPIENKEKISPHTPLLREKKDLPFPKKEKIPTGGDHFFFEKIISSQVCAREGGKAQPSDQENSIQQQIIQLQEIVTKGKLPAAEHNEAIEELNRLKELIFKKKEKYSAKKEKESPEAEPLFLLPPVAPAASSPPKKYTLHHHVKQVFLDFFLERSNHEYYFTARDAAQVSQIIKKLIFLANSKKLEPSDEMLLDSWKIFLEGIRDKWILENLSLSNINSKFNEIINQITYKPDEPRAHNGISEEYRRDVARRIAASGVVFTGAGS